MKQYTQKRGAEKSPEATKRRRRASSRRRKQQEKSEEITVEESAAIFASKIAEGPLYTHVVLVIAFFTKHPLFL